jgi:hypothetical protein
MWPVAHGDACAFIIVSGLATNRELARPLKYKRAYREQSANPEALLSR